jgi:hypothetical protein
MLRDTHYKACHYLFFLLLGRLRRGSRSGFHRPGSVFTGHVDLNQLQVRSRRELLVGKEIGDLAPALDLITLVLARSPEGLRDVFPRPRLDIVVACLPAVDVSLDCVALVAEDETGWSAFTCYGFLGGRTNMMGLSSFLIIVLSSCTVSWILPSPTKRRVRRFFCSLAANAAPWQAPTE